MGIFDRALTTVAKALQIGGRTVSAETVLAVEQQGMDTGQRLGPGLPISPVDGFSRTPRSQDYKAAYNVSARPRTNERVSFFALKGLINSYDIASICITHRIDSIRSLNWTVTPAEGITDDVSESIKLAKRFLKSPDHELPFASWLSKYLWDVLAFDAGTLYRIRNNAGRSIGLRVVDGTTIAPLLDGWGNRPTGDAPAFVQYVQGNVWNWLLSEDIVYVPYRPMSDSPYGRAPIESILINANTDLRFQQYFMDRFTAGNVPAGFGISPTEWGPDQINDWQAAWDALMTGNTEAQQQVRWVPGGSSFTFPNKQEYKSEFSEWLLKKTAAAFHVTPADLGFTMDVNKSSGESQGSVQQRIADLPLAQHVAEILTNFLQDDLGLPLEFKFDITGEKNDKLAQAQADQIYINRGVVSPSEIREERFGKTELEGQVIPRFLLWGQGPIPLSSLMAAAGPIDLETAAPAAGTVIPAQQVEVEAIEAPIVKAVPLGELAATTAELGAFTRFRKARLRVGSWRNFEFREADIITAHRANVEGYGAIRKAAGELVAAGLAVKANDTGRVLMLQRALIEGDPAAGRWEFPGGCLEPGESIFEAAVREWQEETGAILPDGLLTGDWVSPNGVYAGFVWLVDSEAQVPTRHGAGVVLNPDDPDGDGIETLAWFHPNDLVNNPAVRSELSADLSLVLGALFQGEPVVSTSAPIVTDPVPSQAVNVQSESSVVTEEDAAPLAKGWRDSTPKTPIHAYDIPLVDHYTPLITKLLEEFLGQFDVARMLDGVIIKAEGSTLDVVRAAIAREMKMSGANLDQLTKLVETMYADSFVAGEHAAGEQLDPHVVSVKGLDPATVAVNWSNWKPGDPPAAAAISNGGLNKLLGDAGIRIKNIEGSILDQLGNRLGNGLEAGHSIATMTKDIRELIGALTPRSEMIAHTESTRAVTIATLGVYDLNGVGLWELIISDGACDTCVEIEANGPYPTSNEEDAPPVHPWCRCAAAPVVDSIDGSRITSE